MTHHSRKKFPFVAATLLLLPTAVFSQESRLDPQTLLEGLSRENMPELLERFVQNQQSADPLILQQIRIARLRLRMNDASLPPQDRQAALDETLDAMRQCIWQNIDHEQRPLWQTDLAELLLYQLLEQRDQLAGQFIEFGIPTLEQQNAFAKIVPEALEQLIAADERFDALQIELPKQPNHAQDRVQTKLWDRMIERYAHTRTAFLLCQAFYFATWLPDENPLFSRLSSRYWPLEKTHSTAEIKTMMLQSASRRIDQLLRQQAARVDGLTELAQCLEGRIFLAQGKFPQAMTQLDAAAKTGNGDLNDLLCRLARTQTLEHLGKNQAASEALDSLLNHAQSKSNLLARLLVVDAKHRFLLRRAQAWPAQTRDQALAAAYKPYEILLADKSLGDSTTALENYIHQRWESAITRTADLNILPENVLLTISHRMRSQGQNLLASTKNSPDDQQQSLQAQARTKLDFSIKISESLLKRANLSPSTKSGAMFDLALSVYYLNPGDFNNQIRTAEILTNLADQMPDQIVSEQAIKDALAILRPLHAQTPRPPAVAQLYERAGQVLLSKFPTSLIADNERFYFGYSVLHASGKFAQAVDVYSKIPLDHPDYFSAQLQKLIALQAIFRDAPPQEKTKAGIAVDQAAQTLHTQAARAAANATPPAAAAIRRTISPVRLIQIEMAVDRNNLDLAMKLLDSSEQEFSDQPDLLQQVFQKRFTLLLQTRQLERAAALAQKLLSLGTNDALLQSDALLSRIEARVQELQLEIARNPAANQVQSNKAQITQLSQASVTLGKFLLASAASQEQNDALSLRWKLLVAQSLRLLEQPRKSLDLIAPLEKNYTNDAQVIHALAESYFLLGEPANLQNASRYYDMLITRLKQENQHYPALWWNAWLRRLTIADKLSTATSEIPLRVGQLELIDPSLGGDLYKSEFQKLRSKYATNSAEK